jgi:hypothetical protein
MNNIIRVQVKNLEEEKKIEEHARLLVDIWFDLRANPDEVAKDILDFMRHLSVDTRVVAKAYEILKAELGNKVNEAKK